MCAELRPESVLQRGMKPLAWHATLCRQVSCSCEAERRKSGSLHQIADLTRDEVHGSLGAASPITLDRQLALRTSLHGSAPRLL